MVGRTDFTALLLSVWTDGL